MVKVGAKAPQFSLPDQDGATTSLRALSGKWIVLYFYPRDDTPGCTVEACEFTAADAALRRAGAEVFGCSADSAASHQKFIAKHRLGIRLLTDADRTVMTAYGAWGEKVMYGRKVEGVIRSTVLIAPDGTVAHHWAKVKAAGHAAAVLARLLELQGGAGVGNESPAAGSSGQSKRTATVTKGGGGAAAKPVARKKAAARSAAPRRSPAQGPSKPARQPATRKKATRRG